LVTVEQYQLMENPTYLETILVIGAGVNYASAIARKLHKKQPTVTEQLRTLEQAGLIAVWERGEALKFAVKWEILTEAFYEMVRQVVKAHEDTENRQFLSKMEKVELDEVIPRILIENFLKGYIDTFLDLGGKHKGLGELILAFFDGLTNLDSIERRHLVKRYALDEELLESIASHLAIELSINEKITLESLAMD